AVFGAGHVGLELARILARHPLTVHLVDSRAGQLDGARELTGQVAGVHLHHAPAPETVLETLPSGAHVYVMTHDHAEDMVLCDAALRRGDLEVGLIGSRAKWARFRKRLVEDGHPAAAGDSITCPIGLPGLTGKSPAVIAASVAAAPPAPTSPASPAHRRDISACPRRPPAQAGGPGRTPSSTRRDPCAREQ